MLREGFDERDAEGPHVVGRGDFLGCGFGWGVGVRLLDAATRFADPADCVAGEFELIVDGQDVAGFDATVHEALGMKVFQGVEEGLEHFARFGGSEGALGQELREVFFGILHDNVEQIHAGELAAASLEKLDQIWMRELRDLFPAGELSIRAGGASLNEFDGGFLFAFTALGEEYDAVIRAA